MKIGIDIDNVIANSASKFLEFYNCKTNRDLRYEDWNSYNFSEFAGINKIRTFFLITKFYNSEFFDEIDLIEGADEGLRKLCEDSHNLILVTARYKIFKEKTERFLEKNLKDIPLKTYYSGILFKINKLQICKKQGVNLLIEDKLQTALDCAENGIKVFLYSHPWNNSRKFYKNITRVYNWKDILNGIEKLK